LIYAQKKFFCVAKKL